MPLVENHYTVMGFLIKLSDLFFAELDALVISTLLSMVLLWCRELSLEMLSFNLNVVSADALEANGFLVPDAELPDPTAPDVAPLGGTR